MFITAWTITIYGGKKDSRWNNESGQTAQERMNPNYSNECIYIIVAEEPVINAINSTSS